MIGLQMRINNSKIVVNIQAVRIEGEAVDGEICTYEMRVYNHKVSTIACAYGSAIKLGHKMLEEYDKLSDDFVHSLYCLNLLNQVEKAES